MKWILTIIWIIIVRVCLLLMMILSVFGIFWALKPIHIAELYDVMLTEFCIYDRVYPWSKWSKIWKLKWN